MPTAQAESLAAPTGLIGVRTSPRNTYPYRWKQVTCQMSEVRRAILAVLTAAVLVAGVQLLVTGTVAIGAILVLLIGFAVVSVGKPLIAQRRGRR